MRRFDSTLDRVAVKRPTGGVSGVFLPALGSRCLIGALNAARTTIVDALYPPRCAGCARRGTWVCGPCEVALPRFAPPWCERCGLPSVLGRCFCDNLSSGLHILRSAASFDGWLRQAIVSLKYREEWAREGHLGQLLADVLVDLGPIDALVPVPLHPSRLRQRGYNQSALLARRAGEILGIPVLDALVACDQPSSRSSWGLRPAGRTWPERSPPSQM